MAKRSTGTFKHRKNDFYPTPREAVVPLLPHLPDKFTFYEPCAGDGRLVLHLQDLSGGISMGHTDIDPRCSWVGQADAFSVQVPTATDFVITNPPWTRSLLHPMIEHFAEQCPTWFLFDADWIHTKQSIPYLSMCEKIVSIGRVKWIEDSPHTGKDNSCWYLFDAKNRGKTVFYGR
jgi:hypothetical protein